MCVYCWTKKDASSVLNICCSSTISSDHGIAAFASIAITCDINWCKYLFQWLRWSFTPLAVQKTHSSECRHQDFFIHWKCCWTKEWFGIARMFPQEIAEFGLQKGAFNVVILPGKKISAREMEFTRVFGNRHFLQKQNWDMKTWMVYNGRMVTNGLPSQKNSHCGGEATSS